MSNENRIEYLELERKKIWERLTEIEGLLKMKTSDYEAEAKLSSEQAIAFKESSKAANEEILKNFEEIQIKLNSIRDDYEIFESLFLEIKSKADSANSNQQLIEKIYSLVESQAKTINSQVIELQKIFDNKPQLDENLKKLESIFKSGDEYDSKISTLFKSIAERKKEIDELYYEIVGFVEKDKDGNDTEIKGLKDELEESYTLLKDGFAVTEKKLTELNDNQIKLFADFTSEKKNEFEELSKNWNSEYNTVLQKIEELLPHALTTGLSYAYSEKKANEEEENKNHLKSFQTGL